MKLKRFGLIILLACVFALGVSGVKRTVAVAAERKVIISSIANIRSGPGTQYEVLWKVEKYYPIIIINKQGNWYQFKDFENDAGWVHESLVGNVPGVVVIKDHSNIRSGPGTQYEVVFTAERGVPFRQLKQRGNWIKVVHADGDTGWIHRSLVW